MKGFIAAVSCLIVGILIGMMFTCGKVTETNTVTVTRSDTIWPDTVFKELVKRVPGPAKTYTVYAEDSVKSLVNVYKDTLRDSNIVISYQDSISGTLLGKNLSYKLLVPLKITDSVFVKTTEIVDNRKSRLLVGGSFSSGRDFLPLVSYQFPKGQLVGYQYSTLYKEHLVSVSIPIRVSKK